MQKSSSTFTSLQLLTGFVCFKSLHALLNLLLCRLLNPGISGPRWNVLSRRPAVAADSSSGEFLNLCGVKMQEKRVRNRFLQPAVFPPLAPVGSCQHSHSTFKCLSKETNIFSQTEVSALLSDSDLVNRDMLNRTCFVIKAITSQCALSYWEEKTPNKR